MMARSIGLDVGNRRIGVAVSDGAKIIARPLEVIDRKECDAVERIATLTREQQADEIVVGYPYNVDGSSGEQAQRVEQFAESLRPRAGVPLRFYDERYSTSDAQGIIAARKRKAPPSSDDAIAAAVVLQRYLDERANLRQAAEGWPGETSDDEGTIENLAA